MYLPIEINSCVDCKHFKKATYLYYLFIFIPFLLIPYFRKKICRKAIIFGQCKAIIEREDINLFPVSEKQKIKLRHSFAYSQRIAGKCGIEGRLFARKISL